MVRYQPGALATGNVPSLALRAGYRNNVIADANRAALDDTSAQAAAVQQAFADAFVRHVFQMAARFTETDAAQTYFAHAEFALDQMIQRAAARDEIAAGLDRVQGDAAF